MLPIIDIGTSFSAVIVAYFVAINKEWQQLATSYLMITSEGITFDFLDDVLC